MAKNKGIAELAYLEDNQGAARGRMRDEAMRQRIVTALSAVG